MPKDPIPDLPKREEATRLPNPPVVPPSHIRTTGYTLPSMSVTVEAAAHPLARLMASPLDSFDALRHETKHRMAHAPITRVTAGMRSMQGDRA